MGSRPRRVVVVDDHEEVRRLVTSVLRRDGRFDVVGEAADGLQAVTTVRIAQPDIVVLDHDMPELDGVDAIPLLQHATPKVWIVLFASAPTGRETPAAPDGPDVFVPKLAPIEDLVERLCSCPDPLRPAEAAATATAHRFGVARQRHSSRVAEPVLDARHEGSESFGPYCGRGMGAHQ